METGQSVRLTEEIPDEALNGMLGVLFRFCEKPSLHIDVVVVQPDSLHNLLIRCSQGLLLMTRKCQI